MLIKCYKRTNITGGPPCTTPKATKASRVRGRTFQLPRRGMPPPLIASLRCILRSLVKSPRGVSLWNHRTCKFILTVWLVEVGIYHSKCFFSPSPMGEGFPSNQDIFGSWIRGIPTTWFCFDFHPHLGSRIVTNQCFLKTWNLSKSRTNMFAAEFWKFCVWRTWIFGASSVAGEVSNNPLRPQWDQGHLCVLLAQPMPCQAWACRGPCRACQRRRFPPATGHGSTWGGGGFWL